MIVVQDIKQTNRQGKHVVDIVSLLHVRTPYILYQSSSKNATQLMIAARAIQQDKNDGLKEMQRLRQKQDVIAHLINVVVTVCVDVWDSNAVETLQQQLRDVLLLIWRRKAYIHWKRE